MADTVSLAMVKLVRKAEAEGKDARYPGTSWSR
jgi:hypothetical protein